MPHAACVMPVRSTVALEFGVPLLSRGFVRRRVIWLTTSLAVMATSFALAQDPKQKSHVRAVTDIDEQQFLFENDLAMSNMTRSLLIKPARDVDRDFVDIMVTQHQGAIDMARAEIKYGHNDELRQLAEEMVKQQEQEISMMRGALPPSASQTPSTSDSVASYAPN
jgi:uncharacterized protein (DUF305 family)